MRTEDGKPDETGAGTSFNSAVCSIRMRSFSDVACRFLPLLIGLAALRKKWLKCRDINGLCKVMIEARYLGLS